MTMLTLHELSPSPNNTKVRMALRYKQLDFEAREIDRMDRSALVEISGQEMSPVLEDPVRGVVLPDSEAILQYLEANYRESPRLFPSDKAERRVCEGFKRELDQRLAQHWLNPFFFAIGVEKELDKGSIQRFQAGLGWLNEQIGEGEHAHPSGWPINDLRAAQWATYALPGSALIERCPPFAKFAELFGVEPGRFTSLERWLAPWQRYLG